MTLEHRATLHLTGWATPAPDGCRILGQFVELRRPLDGPARVDLHLRPGTDASGRVTSLKAGGWALAQAPNGSHLTVTGQILRMDRGEGLITLLLSPFSTRQPPYRVTVRAAQTLLRDVAPELSRVTVSGELLVVEDMAVLLATAVQAADAPVPEHWRTWRKDRRKPRRRPKRR